MAETPGTDDTPTGADAPVQPEATGDATGEAAASEAVGDVTAAVETGGVASSDPDAGAPPAERRTRRRWPWIAGAAAVVLVGGGAWAYSVLSGGGQQPADVFPASADVYFRIDLDPSAGQKLAAVQLADRFPALEGVSEDLADSIVEALFTSAEEGDPEFAERFSYEEDFEPWLGDRFGVAVVLDDLDEPTPLIAVQVTDREAAEETLPELVDYADADSEGETAWRFVGDYVVLAPSQEQLDRYADEAEESPLSDDERFGEMHSSLGDPGIASFWVDLDLDQLASGDFTAQGEVDAVPASYRLAVADEDGDDDDGEESELGSLAVAGAVRLDSSNIDLVGTVVSDPGSVEALPAGSIRSIDPAGTLGSLPESTMLALSWGGVVYDEQQQAELWEQVTQPSDIPSVTPDDWEAEAEEFLGVSLPEDLFALLANEVTVVADGALLETMSGATGAEFAFDVALRFVSPDDESAAAVEKLVGLVETFGIPVSVDQDGDVTVIAFSDGYLDALTGDGGTPTLADSDRMDRLLPTTDPVWGLWYFDIEGVVDSLDDLGAEIPDDVRENLDPLEAAIVTGWSGETPEGDAPLTADFALRLTLSED